MNLTVTRRDLLTLAILQGGALLLAHREPAPYDAIALGIGIGIAVAVILPYIAKKVSR